MNGTRLISSAAGTISTTATATSPVATTNQPPPATAAAQWDPCEMMPRALRVLDGDDRTRSTLHNRHSARRFFCNNYVHDGDHEYNTDNWGQRPLHLVQHAARAFSCSVSCCCCQ